jgi:hypothetical protein
MELYLYSPERVVFNLTMGQLYVVILTGPLPFVFMLYLKAQHCPQIYAK